MDKEFWRAFGSVAAIIVGTPLILASVRAIFFFGQVSQSVKNMESSFKEHVLKIDKFIEEMHEFCEVTDRRLTRIELERDAEQKYGRRSTDRDVTKDINRPS